MNNKNINLAFIPFDGIPIPGQLYKLDEKNAHVSDGSTFVALGKLPKAKKQSKIVGLLKKTDRLDQPGLYVCIGRLEVHILTKVESRFYVCGELVDDIEHRESDYLTAKHTIRDLLSISHLLHAQLDEKELRTLDPKSLSWLLSATDALTPLERAQSFNTRSISKRLRIFSQAIKNAVRNTKSRALTHLCN